MLYHLIVAQVLSLCACALPTLQARNDTSVNGASPGSPGSSGSPGSPSSPPVSPFARCPAIPLRAKGIAIYTDWEEDPELGVRISGYFEQPSYLCFDIYDDHGSAIAHYENQAFGPLIREVVKVQRQPDFDGAIDVTLIPKTVVRDRGVVMKFKGEWDYEQITTPIGLRFQGGLSGNDGIGFGGASDGGNVTVFRT